MNLGRRQGLAGRMEKCDLTFLVNHYLQKKKKKKNPRTDKKDNLHPKTKKQP